MTALPAPLRRPAQRAVRQGHIRGARDVGATLTVVSACNPALARQRNRNGPWGLDAVGARGTWRVSVFVESGALGSAWTANDPIGFNGGTTNLYEYAANDPVNRTDPLGLLIVPANNEAAGLLAGFGASGASARQLIDFVDACSVQFNIYGDTGIPDHNMCSEDTRYGATGNSSDGEGWERGRGADREVDIRVDSEKARASTEGGIDADRFADATLGHELIHAAKLCEAMQGDPFISVLNGGGIPLVEDFYATHFVLESLMHD